VHRIDLRPHTEVALAVTERADDAPYGVVHLGDVLAQEAAVPTRWTSRPGLPDTNSRDSVSSDMRRSVPLGGVALLCEKRGVP
jgi:hypothetical protein